MTDRRDFGRSVGLGLGAAALAAVAAHSQWVTTETRGQQAGALAEAVLADGADTGSSPAAGAIALVLLAAWGVLLVTRGGVRRGVAVLGLLAALGLVAAVVVGRGDVPDGVRTALGPGSGVDVGLGAWFWVTGLAAVASVAATLHAVRRVPTWPEMGTRYDAPARAPGSGPAGDEGAAATAVPAAGEDLEDRTNLDLWRSLDQGRDPTA